MSSPNRQPQAPAPDSGSVAIPNDREAIERVQQEVVQAVERHSYPKAAVFAIRLSLHEAIANAFGHGHKNLPATVPVKVSYAVSDKKVTLAVQDQGPGFDPHRVPDPTLDENLEVPSGRGLMLMRAYMTRVEYNANGTRLELEYQKPA